MTNLLPQIGAWITGLFTEPAQQDGSREKAATLQTLERKATMTEIVLQSGYVVTIQRPENRVPKPIAAADLSLVAEEFIEYDKTITQVSNDSTAPEPTVL
tara:strand:+ start:186 stop:485 length:300 start_codon:yes stop_codon:yes gene_type:complete